MRSSSEEGSYLSPVDLNSRPKVMKKKKKRKGEGPLMARSVGGHGLLLRSGSRV